MSLRQNERLSLRVIYRFSYQSECHCAKTSTQRQRLQERLVTSQNVTAPKRVCFLRGKRGCLVTSQNVTAPKPLSQNLPCKETSIPTGSEITSEQSSRSIACLFSFILSWIDVSVSIRRACIPRKIT